MTNPQLEAVVTAEVARIKRPYAEVRLGRFHDVFGIRMTLQRALEETETPLPPPEEPYCYQQLMDRVASGMVSVAEVDDRIVGCIVLAINHWPWVSPGNAAGHYIYNQHFYVDPQNRKGGIAQKLLTFAKEKSNDLGLPLMMEISTADSNTDLKDRFVKQAGFRYVGGKLYRQAQGD